MVFKIATFLFCYLRSSLWGILIVVSFSIKYNQAYSKKVGDLFSYEISETLDDFPNLDYLYLRPQVSILDITPGQLDSLSLETELALNDSEVFKGTSTFPKSTSHRLYVLGPIRESNTNLKKDKDSGELTKAQTKTILHTPLLQDDLTPLTGSHSLLLPEFHEKQCITTFGFLPTEVLKTINSSLWAWACLCLLRYLFLSAQVLNRSMDCDICPSSSHV